METKAYKIDCARNSEAISVHEHLSKELYAEESGIEIFREGKQIFIRAEDIDEEMMDKDDIQSIIDDAVLVYELDYTPELTDTMYAFEISAERPDFPFDCPQDKIADMIHDGYTFEEAVRHTKKAFGRELTPEELSQAKGGE